MTSSTKTFLLLLVVLQLAAVTPVLSRSGSSTGTSTRGNKSRHTLYRPAAAYKWLYPIHAAFDAVIASLTDLQREIIQLCRTLFTYFAIYHDLYHFISKVIMTILIKAYNLCHRLLSLNLPSSPFSSWSAVLLRRFTSTNQSGHATLLSVPVKYIAVALVAAAVVAFCVLSESPIARRVRRVGAFVARLVMVPPVVVTMDITPVVHGLLRIVSKSVRVVIALLALVFTIARAAVMTVLTGGPVFTVSVVVSMLAAGVVVWWWWSFVRPRARAVTDPGSTTSTSTSTSTTTRETAATVLLSNTSSTPLSSASAAQRPSQIVGDDDIVDAADRNGNTNAQSAATGISTAAADSGTKMSCCSGCRQNDALPVDREIVDVDINSNSHLSSSSSSNDVAQEGLRQRRAASSTPPIVVAQSDGILSRDKSE